jgi:TPR repeat protein
MKEAKLRHLDATLEAANSGDVSAQRALGLRLIRGDGISQSVMKGLAMLEEAAERDPSGRAANDLGKILTRGEHGVEEDDEAACRWFRRAARRGSIDGNYNLACCLAHGWGVKPSDMEAARHFKEAAEKGHAEAQWQLGMLFQRFAFREHATIHRLYAEASAAEGKVLGKSAENARMRKFSARSRGIAKV